jgi:hypothetical protein
MVFAMVTLPLALGHLFLIGPSEKHLRVFIEESFTKLGGLHFMDEPQVRKYLKDDPLGLGKLAWVLAKGPEHSLIFYHYLSPNATLKRSHGMRTDI